METTDKSGRSTEAAPPAQGQQQKTAIDLWIDELERRLKPNLWLRFSNQNHQLAIRAVVSRNSEALVEAIQMLAMYHLKIRRSCMELLKQCEKNRMSMIAEFKRTPWFLFRKRARLRRELNANIARTEAIEETLKIIINTPPSKF